MTHPSEQQSFLAGKTLGQANYLLLALLAAFLIAFIPLGARRAFDSNINKAEDWLPHGVADRAELNWFREHFPGEQFAVVSWDGCTLGNTEKLEQLSRKLIPSQDAIAHAPAESDLRNRYRWYKRVITGPEVLAELTSPPLSLNYDDATQRVEGALVGPVKRDATGRSLGNETRTTCLVVYLSPEATSDNRQMRRAIEQISDIAANECAIPRESIHMAGPPVDNVTIDIESTRTLGRLAALAAVVGFCLACWCFRILQAPVMVMAIGIASAGMGLAAVFYFGIAEVLLLGATRPLLGTVDAVLMSMPAVLYVLGLSGAIYLVKYYRDACQEHGLAGAAEAAVRHCWWPCVLTAATMMVGVGSLLTSDILPIRRFGFFTSIGIMLCVGILFLMLPVMLYRFPLTQNANRQSGSRNSTLPDWVLNIFGMAVGRHGLACLLLLLLTGALAVGLTRVDTSVRLLELLDEKSDLIQDYAWLESHLGHVVPMELVVTVPSERIRAADEHAEQDGKQYKMTMLERLEMIREIQFRIEALPEVSRALSAATFAPSNTNTGVSTAADRSGDYAINKSLEDHRAKLLSGDYLRMERRADSGQIANRELWRVSARIAALRNPRNEQESVDYGRFVEQLRIAVDPVLVAYQQRDMIVQQLHEQGKRLDGAQVCILYRTPNGAPEPTFTAQESVLANLLLKSGVQPKTLDSGKRVRGVSFYNLTDFDAHASEPRYLVDAVKALEAQDALILVSAGSDPTAKKFAEGGLNVIDVTNVSLNDSSALHIAESGEPRPLGSVYTGIVPLVCKTQRQVLHDLKDSILWASLLTGAIMITLSRSAVGGFVAMLPNVFPIVVIFGMLGWLSIKVDIGIMLSASVALGLSVGGTIHFLTWFRHGTRLGLDRIQAVIHAYDRCAAPMIHTTIIAGLGLAVFAFSTFTPTQQFGYLIVSLLTAALIGDLILLPALLAGPLGFYFGGHAPRMNVRRLAMPGEFAKATERLTIRLRSGIETEIETDFELPSLDEVETPIETPDLTQSVTATTYESVAAESHEVAVDEPPVATTGAERVEIHLPDDDSRRDLVDGPHADLHARLRNLRREAAERRKSL